MPLCRNCHAIATEGQRDVGADLTPQPTLLHQLAAALLSLGSFLTHLGEQCVGWAHDLRALIDRLDATG